MDIFDRAASGGCCVSSCSFLFIFLILTGRVLPVSGRWPVATKNMKSETVGVFVSELVMAANKAGVSISAENITIYDDMDVQPIGAFSFINPSLQCGSQNPIHKAPAPTEHQQPEDDLR